MNPTDALIPGTAWPRVALRAGVVLVGLLVLVVAGGRLGAYVVGFAGWVEGLGVWGPAVFVAGYAAATVAFVPGSLLTLAAGAIFGLAGGVAYVLAGATAGSAAAFLIARHVARGPVERRIAGEPRFEAVDRAIGREGLKIVLLLRLSPVFPYNLLNYALGLTRVRLGHYLLGSLGMVPGTFLYVYTGRVVGDVAALAAGVAVDRSPGYYAVVGGGFLATAVVTWYVTRLAGRALREAEG